MEWNTWLLSLECVSWAIWRRLIFFEIKRTIDDAMAGGVEILGTKWMWYITALPLNFNKNRVRIIKNKPPHLWHSSNQTECKLASLQAGPWTGSLSNLSEKTRHMFTRVELVFESNPKSVPQSDGFPSNVCHHFVFSILRDFFLLTIRYIIVYAIKFHIRCNKNRWKKAESITNKLSSNQLNSSIFWVL